MAKKKEEEPRLKSAFDAPRAGGFYRFDPDEIIVPGIDNDAKSDYALHDVSSRHQLSEELVLSIMAEGVHTPIMVRKDGSSPEVINGRRRVLHAREANKRLKKMGADPITILAEVRRVASDKEAVLLMLSSNAHALGEDPVDRAEKVAKAVRLGAKEEEVAVAVGFKTVEALRGSQKILDCSDEVKNAVRANKLSATAAIKLSELPRTQQNAALEQLLTGETKPTVAAVARTVHDTIAKTAAAPARAEAASPAKSTASKPEKAAATPSDDDGDAASGRGLSRGASAAYAPGRKQIRETIEILRSSPKSEWQRGMIEGLKFVLGEEVPKQLQVAREQYEAEAAKKAKKESAKK